MTNVKDIDTFSHVSTSKLPRYIEEKIFNPFIRQRDSIYGWCQCISCQTQFKAFTDDGKSTGAIQAGHYYAKGSFSWLRLDIDNVHGQCVRCNIFLKGNEKGYTSGLIERIGIDRFHALKRRAEDGRRVLYKPDRGELLNIIEMCRG